MIHAQIADILIRKPHSVALGILVILPKQVRLGAPVSF